jgi:hypothetical protein
MIREKNREEEDEFDCLSIDFAGEQDTLRIPVDMALLEKDTFDCLNITLMFEKDRSALKDGFLFQHNGRSIFMSFRNITKLGKGLGIIFVHGSDYPTSPVILSLLYVNTTNNVFFTLEQKWKEWTNKKKNNLRTI